MLDQFETRSATKGKKRSRENIIKRETVCEVKDSDKNINKACTFKKTVDSNPSPGDMKNRGVNKSKNKTAFTLDKIQDNYLISVKILRKEIIQA